MKPLPARTFFRSRQASSPAMLHLIHSLLVAAAVAGLAACGSGLAVAAPPAAEQAAIAKVLLDMDAEIAAVEARRDKTTLIKQGMMQELLTGRTRLGEAAP